MTSNDSRETPHLPLCVIAAGEGSRLQVDSLPKPLYPINGRPLISYILSSALEAEISECHVLVRESDDALRRYLDEYRTNAWALHVHFQITKGTGWATRELQAAIDNRAHLMSTADVICGGRDVRLLLDAYHARSATTHALLGVTSQIGADRPIYVRIVDGVVTDYGKDIAPQQQVWANMRAVTATYSRWTSAATAGAAADTEMTRQFMLAYPGSVRAVRMNGVFDVDTPEEARRASLTGRQNA